MTFWMGVFDGESLSLEVDSFFEISDLTGLFEAGTEHACKVCIGGMVIC